MCVFTDIIAHTAVIILRMITFVNIVNNRALRSRILFLCLKRGMRCSNCYAYIPTINTTNYPLTINKGI